MHQIPTEQPSPPYPLRIDRASFENLFNVSYWLWRLNPSTILPVMLDSAFSVLKQSVIAIAIIYVLSRLASVGILKELAEAVQVFDFQLLVSTFSQILSQITITVGILVGVFFVVSIVASGFVNSVEYGSYLRVLRVGVLSTPDVLNEARGRWVNMTWTALIVEAVKNWPVILGGVWILFDILNLPSMSSLSLANRIPLWLGIMLLAAFVMLVLTLLTVYSYPAAIFGLYGFAAVKESIRVFMKLPSHTIIYALLRAVSAILVGIIALLTSFIGVQISAITTILIGFIITPVFHIFKTSIFLKSRTGTIFAPLPIGPPISEDVCQYVWRTGLERTEKGFRELVKFLDEPRNIVAHISSALMLFVGIILGKRIASSGIRQVIDALGVAFGEVSPSFRPYSLPFLALDISFHNWQVSLATALSGTIFAVPTITMLIFNGFILGVVEDVVQNTAMFLAATLPHGIIELPSFIIAGSTGLKLGFSFIKALKRRSLSSDPEFIKNLRQTVYVILGLMPLFLVAGIVEAFITPQIMRIFGWK